MKRVRVYRNGSKQIQLSSNGPWNPLMLSLLLIGVLIQPGWGYSGGLGSVQAPYLIGRAEDLIELGQNPRDYDKHFFLINDIDLSDYLFDRAVIAPHDGYPFFSSSFVDQEAFSGTINGNGHVIRSLRISGDANLGLVGAMGPEAWVSSLGIVDANIVGTQRVAMLAGANSGRIVNCYSSGSTSGTYAVGGLVGENRGGTLTNTYSTGHVSGTHSMGGLIGIASFGADIGTSAIVNSYSTCMVTTVNESSVPTMGGLVGSENQRKKRGEPDLDPGSGWESSGCFWDAQTSGISEGISGIGLPTEQMQNIDTYLQAGWDFLGEQANGCQDIWSMPEAGGTPVLTAFNTLDLTVTTGDGPTGNHCTLLFEPTEIVLDASARFAVHWDSLAVTRVTLNPLAGAEGARDPGIVVSISGRIEGLDAPNLIGMDEQEGIVCRVTDEQGDDVTLRSNAYLFEPDHCWNLRKTPLYPFTLQMQLNLDQAVPTVLSQIDFYVYALFAQPLTVIDIPIGVTEDWVDVVPGLQVSVAIITLQDGTYQYTLSEKRHDLSHVRGILKTDVQTCEPLGLSHPFHMPDLAAVDLVYNRDIIDSNGNILSSAGPDFSSGGRSGSSTSSRMCSDSGCPVCVRYTIGVKPYKLVVPLTLTDIPVSGF
jgi:hypothetical protein